ncbi:TIGR02594 family protein [Flavobacterium sp. ov086]|uniref:TIGR02594 family protein n=1 Tax=Flavobacterium sp. ov086 TaxID=1761785 RepID=UPI000B6590BE|nr:TIGR02594 family protein [Flavobacterium sp. ov086]SNS04313.1 TIGR02594 family protein [Flavobacterium sp. ov086]
MPDFKIIGNPNPEVGKEVIYTVSNSVLPESFLSGQTVPAGDNPFTEQVKWSLYALEYGKWYLKGKNNKTGPTANYTFTEISLSRKGIRIVAQLGEEEATLDIKPIDTIKRKIVKVELCDALGNLQTKPFGYNQTVIARVHCTNLDNCTVHVTLWEDDAPGAGHNEINKNNKAVTKSELVSNGIADIKFRLDIDFAKMANAQLARGDKSEGKTHEYYVTAEVFRQKTVSSNNINVINPDHKTTDSKPADQKPVKPRPAAPAETKGKSKKTEKGLKEPVSGTIYDWSEAVLKAIPMILPDPIEVVNSLAKVFMPDKKEKKEDICVCKENNFYWSDKLTCDERKKVLEVCAKLWGEKNKKDKASELMAVIHLETGDKTPFKPYADNGVGFSGLIQFSDSTAQGLGTTRAKLKEMTFIKQMDYVHEYFSQRKDQLVTMTDLYLLVLKPNAVGNGHNSGYVLFDESISIPDGDGSTTSYEQRMKNINREPWVTKYGYASNPHFMKENGEYAKREKWVYTRQKKEMRWGFHNGRTTVGEVTQGLKEKHYNPGSSQLFNGKCDDIVEKKNAETTGERAPWMKLAWIEEAKKLVETGKNKAIQKFFEKTPYEKSMKDGTTDEKDVAWCAAFINWIMTNYGYKGIEGYDAVRALKWANWDEGRDLKKPVYGAIAVKTRKGGGHVGFVAGKKGNKIVILGGNQGDALCCVTYSESNYFAYIVPKDYQVIEEDYNLPEYEGNPGEKGSES